MFKSKTFLGIVIGIAIIPLNTFLINSYYNHEKYIQDQLNGLPVEYRNAIEACSDFNSLESIIFNHRAELGKLDSEQYKFILTYYLTMDQPFTDLMSSHLNIKGN